MAEEKVTILKIEVDQESAKRELIAVEQALIKLRAEQSKYKKELQDSGGENKKAAEALVNTKNEIKKATVAQRDLTKAVNAEKGSLNELKSQLAQMVIQRNKINLSTREGQREFDRLNKEILKHNNVIKRAESQGGSFQRNVGNYPKLFSAATTKLIAFVGGFYLLIRVLKDIGSTIKNFQVSQANLAAILGKTRGEIQGLTDDSLRYGKATTFTATQVTGLQTELAKLGFTIDEIRASTGAILNLSEATGADLANAAKVSGAALRAFSLDATEMDRVTSVLAVATTKSALSFNDYETALSTVAPVARAYGFTIEQTVALLGKLRDAGFDASSAATATRNIILNLADSSGALSKALGGNIKSFDDLIPALATLRDKGVDLNTTLELTDKRSVAAFSQFLTGAESAGELAKELVDVNDELQQMVEVKLDTIAGDVFKLKSAWEGLILSIETGEGAIGRSARFLIQHGTAVLQFATNLDLAFKRESKLISKDFDRIIDDLNAFTTESGKLISDITKDFDKLLEGVTGDELKSRYSEFRGLMVAQLEAEGESTEVAIGIWLAYLRRHTKELEESVKRENSVRESALEAEKKRIAEEDYLRQEAAQKEAARKQKERDKELEIEWERTQALKERELNAYELIAQREQLAEETSKSEEKKERAEEKTARASYFAWRKAEFEKTQATKDAAVERVLIAEWEKEANIAATGMLAGAITGLLRKSSAEYKFFKSAEALISAYTAINQVWADPTLPSFFAKLAASISVGITTLSNVAKINQIQFAEGGYIGNRGIKLRPDKRGDNRMIIARDDEVILNSIQQARIGAGTLKSAGVPGFADGGLVRSVSQPAIQEADQTNAIVSAVQRRQPIYVAVRDINRGQDRVMIKDKISRL